MIFVNAADFDKDVVVTSIDANYFEVNRDHLASGPPTPILDIRIVDNVSLWKVSSQEGTLNTCQFPENN